MSTRRSINSVTNQTYIRKMDEIQMDNRSDFSINIENEDEVSIAIKRIIAKGCISSRGARHGICIFLWRRIQKSMTPNDKFFFS